jgi:hypothetical protein
MSGTSSAPGIVPRAISELFSVIEATAAEEKDVYFYVRISLVELYNNNFRCGVIFVLYQLACSALLCWQELVRFCVERASS